MMRTSVTLLAAAVLAPAAAAQMPPMPDHPVLRDGWLAWDAGDYPAALRAYRSVLAGPDGASHLREVAALTGEVHPVMEVAADGTDLRMAPDGSRASFDVFWRGRVLTHLVDPRTGEVVDTVTTAGSALGADGLLAWFTTERTAAFEAALARADEAGARRDFAARNQARAEAFYHEVAERTLHVRQDGVSRTVDLGGRVPLSVVGTGDGPDLFVVAGRPGATTSQILRLRDGSIEAVEAGVTATDPLPVPGGRYLVVSVLERSPMPRLSGGTPASAPARPGVSVLDLNDGSAVFFDGAQDPVVSADGSTLVLLWNDDGRTEVRSLPLTAAALRDGPAALRVVARADTPLAAPALSPDGARVAYQAMPHDDWEIFVAPSDGSAEPTQITWEIQHDLFPTWLDDRHVLAAKGEGRHRRSYVYDVDTGEHVKLFHNNTVRTIAPEYEWAATPDGSRVLIVAERDGDTVSPERGVYLVDRSATVGLADVRSRIDAALAAEEDLRARGRAAFAPVADAVRPVTEAISVSRIYEYARDVYVFGSKFITQPGNAKAIEYYTGTLRSFGYEPELEWFEPRPGVRTANIIVRIPGTVDPELVYVASSHFDSVERGPGADDDSSGGTALLEVARVLKDHPLPATVELAFFTGEEAGLLGSREYVRRAVASGKRIVGALNNDMIGWANSPRLDNTIRYSNPGIRDIQHAAAMQFSDLITYDALYYKNTDAHAYYEVYGDIVGASAPTRCWATRTTTRRPTA
ncbi:MAG: M20/M25/M40 family metallo-hydrolase [Longimicrobiales bacterium]